MLVPPNPPDEPERLAALRALHMLDTPSEERFDRITRLMGRIFQVPMAFVSLVDAERQWFKSSTGLDVIQTPRSISFCGHAILSDLLLVVPDARLDSRFHDNPLVTGPTAMRFYAGQPLRGPGGHNIGTLCIADRKPRELSEREQQILVELAAIVERELGLVEAVSLQDELIATKARVAESERIRAEALEQVVAGQRRLVRELDQAAAYVRSLLPVPIADPPVRTCWQYEPSSALGGDSFGYEWIDPDHFALYLLDVSGHGVGAALLSVSVVNTIRARTLRRVDFRDPSQVLSALNAAYPMEQHDGKYFTLWYGVYRPSDRHLTFAAAGHPPAVLLGTNGAEPVELGAPNLAIGMFSETEFPSDAVTVPSASHLELFSDGVFEIERPDGSMMSHADLIAYFEKERPRGPHAVWEHVRRIVGAAPLRDDFSLLEVQFD